MLDECVIEDIKDSWPNKELPEYTDIRIEVTLKKAAAMFERRGPDVCEVFSQPRVCHEAEGMDKETDVLTPGWSLDLTTVDPLNGRPWDLSVPTVQSRVRKLVRDTRPFCIVGSPPCTAFSPLQEISRAKRDPKKMLKELDMAKKHVKFCVELYKMQIRDKRHFVHEHPTKSKAWQMDEIKELMMRPEVGKVELHMCALGMKSCDEQGEGLVHKSTTLMSSSEEVLRIMDRRCSNESQSKDHNHRHVYLIQGRSKAAQVYPREFCERLCEGIAAQKKVDKLGLKSRPLMSLDEMKSAAKGGKGDECPSEALNESDGTGMTAIDDITGQELDPKFMIKARKDEIAYFREMGVYDKVDVSESWKVTGKAPIAVRWVDINKGDTANPNYRSRLVAKEFNTGVFPELYAATPPSECLRIILSKLASSRSKGVGLMYADVSRAYFYAEAVSQTPRRG